MDSAGRLGRPLTAEDGVGEERRGAGSEDREADELDEGQEVQQVNVDLRQLPLCGAQPVPTGGTQRLDLRDWPSQRHGVASSARCTHDTLVSCAHRTHRFVDHAWDADGGHVEDGLQRVIARLVRQEHRRGQVEPL